MAALLTGLLGVVTVNNTARASGDSGYTTHQGIDSCGIPSNTELQDEWSGTPFYQWGFYLGGNTATYLGCDAWTQSKLDFATNVGWGVTPIWDGKQAPVGCTDSSPYHMSSNTTTAQAQGVASAQDARAAMDDLGFEEFDIVWLDIEAYDTSQDDCRAAVRAYVDGWSQELELSAGVYSTPAIIKNFWNLTHRPNSVWVAFYNSPTPNPNTVWGLGSLPDDRWPDSGAWRMHQYRNSRGQDDLHFNVDIDCADAWIDFGLLNSGFNPTAQTCLRATQP